MLRSSGVDPLARSGTRRLKVGFATDAASNRCLGADFASTSVDRRFTRPHALEEILRRGRQVAG